MNIKKLEETVESIKTMAHFGASDYDLIKELVEFLYEESDGSLLNYILIIDEIKKREVKQKEQTLYGGLEDAMHNLSSYSRKLHETKQPLKELRALDRFLTGEVDGNIASMIRIAMAYFPKGDSNGASENGKYFFERFKETLVANKDKYLTGDSSDWAKHYGYYDYIKMVIEKHKPANIN